MLYVNNNGEILNASGYTIRTGSRAYMYGDGVFESIRIMNGKPINLENHLLRMMEGAKRLKMRPPSYYNLEFFATKIDEIIQKSGIVGGGRCRISLDRSIGGTYMPEANEVEYFIEVYPLENNLFELNSKGKEVDIYMELKKDKNYLSNFKTKNGLVYIMSAITAKEKGLDDYLITNYSDRKSVV